MKASIYIKPDRLAIADLEKPVVTKEGAIIKVHGCGLCGSDIVKFKQGLIPTGTVLGHEIVGQIDEINIQNSKFKVGDRVVAGHHVPCYKCDYCKNESYYMCKGFK